MNMRILLSAGVSALSVATVAARPAFVLEENVHAAVLSSMGGSFDQDGWAHNYGSRQHSSRGCWRT